MKTIRICLPLVAVFLIATVLPLHAQQPAPPTTIAATLDSQISGIEKQIIAVAEAVPDDKFNFSPADFARANPTMATDRRRASERTPGCAGPRFSTTQPPRPVDD